jgi:hypothetical protein
MPTDDSAAEGDGKADGWGLPSERDVLVETHQPSNNMQDATHVYYTVFTDEDAANSPQTMSVMRVRRSDGMAEKIGSLAGFPARAELGGNFIYFADYDGIQKLPKAGGEAQRIADLDNHPSALAADATGVYFSIQAYENNQYIHRLTKIAAGTTTPVVLARGTYITDIAVDSTNVYWLDETQPNPAIGCGQNAGVARKVSKLGGADIMLQAGIHCPLSLSLDATNVYWVSWALDGGAAVSKLSKLGGLATLVGLSASTFAQSDGIYVYYIGMNGDLVRQPKTLGLPRIVAKDVGEVIGADAMGVYFWRESLEGESRTYSLHSLGR